MYKHGHRDREIIWWTVDTMSSLEYKYMKNSRIQGLPFLENKSAFYHSVLVNIKKANMGAA